MRIIGLRQSPRSPCARYSPQAKHQKYQNPLLVLLILRLQRESLNCAPRWINEPGLVDAPAYLPPESAPRFCVSGDESAGFHEEQLAEECPAELRALVSEIVARPAGEERPVAGQVQPPGAPLTVRTLEPPSSPAVMRRGRDEPHALRAHVVAPVITERDGHALAPGVQLVGHREGPARPFQQAVRARRAGRRRFPDPYRETGFDAGAFSHRARPSRSMSAHQRRPSAFRFCQNH